MNTTDKVKPAFGIVGGIIIGAIIDNMALGIIIGFAVGCGLFQIGRKTSAKPPVADGPDQT